MKKKFLSLCSAAVVYGLAFSQFLIASCTVQECLELSCLKTATGCFEFEESTPECVHHNIGSSDGKRFKPTGNKIPYKNINCTASPACNNSNLPKVGDGCGAPGGNFDLETNERNCCSDAEDTACYTCG